MSGKHANIKELARIAEYNRTHRVGVPNEGEKVCPSCNGHGQLNSRIMGPGPSGYQPCERCFGTGCVKARVIRGRDAAHRFADELNNAPAPLHTDYGPASWDKEP